MFEEVQKEDNRQFSNNIRQRLDEAIQKTFSPHGEKVF